MSVSVRLVGLAFCSGGVAVLLIIRAEAWYLDRKRKRSR